MVQDAALLLQGVSACRLPDSGVTAAGPAGTTAGQAQLVVPRHAGLSKKKRKRESSKSGVASGRLQAAFLAQTC